MLCIAVCACAALVGAARIHYALAGDYTSPENSTNSAPDNSTIKPSTTLATGAVIVKSGRRSGKFIEAIRRQLMQDNYDYANKDSYEIETSMSDMSMTSSMATSQRAGLRTTTEETYAIRAHSHLTKVESHRTMKLIHEQTYLANITPRILPMDEVTDSYIMLDKGNKFRANENDEQVKENRKLEVMKNDLLYYVDDKHLRRNNDLSADVSAKLPNYDDSLTEYDSDNEDNNMTRRLHKQRNKELYRKRRGYYQRSKKYGYRRGSKGTNQKRGPRNHNKQSALSNAPIEQEISVWRDTHHSNQEESNDENYDQNHQFDDKYAETEAPLTQMANDEKNEPIVETVASNETEEHNSKENNQQNNKIDNKEQSQSEDSDVGIYRPVNRRQYNNLQHDLTQRSNRSRQDIQQDNNKDHISQDEPSLSQKQNKKQYMETNSQNAIQTTATPNVKYKLLKVPGGRKSRRSGSGAERQLLERRDSQGVALIALDPAPFPQFRLPLSRRQYMQDNSDEQPIAKQLSQPPLTSRRQIKYGK